MKGVEDDLVARHFSEKVREHVDGHLLAGAAPIAEAERREACIVADRCGLSVRYREYSAEAAVGDAGLAPIANGKRRNIEGQRGSPICLHFASSTSALVGTLK